MNTVCHIEFQTSDLDRSQAFFEGVFGWEFKAFVPGMRVFGTGESHVGGVIQVDEVKHGRSLSVWIKVAKLEETLGCVESHGGRLTGERIAISRTGWWAGFDDPDGNPIGIVEFS